MTFQYAKSLVIVTSIRHLLNRLAGELSWLFKLIFMLDSTTLWAFRCEREKGSFFRIFDITRQTRNTNEKGVIRFSVHGNRIRCVPSYSRVAQ